MLQNLNAWFVSHCNGAWEHRHGIQIETCDNPGWIVSIDTGRHLGDERVIEQSGAWGEDGAPWLDIRVRDGKLVGACDPKSVAHLDWRLVELLKDFEIGS